MAVGFVVAVFIIGLEEVVVVVGREEVVDVGIGFLTAAAVEPEARLEKISQIKISLLKDKKKFRKKKKKNKYREVI